MAGQLAKTYWLADVAVVADVADVAISLQAEVLLLAATAAATDTATALATAIATANLGPCKDWHLLTGHVRHLLTSLCTHRPLY